MGNCNSGRCSFGDAKATVEDCLSIDTVGWLREGLSRPYTVTFGNWRFISYEIDTTNAQVRLQYMSQTGQHLDYCVDLVSTCPHFGGLRWWFLCPAMASGRTCGRRVRKLYLALAGRFACRQCCHLGYTSQREDDMSRAISKAQAIRERLGGSASMAQSFPEKPKRMWRRTYRRLRARAEGLWLAGLKAGLGRPRE
jgi:hypothetical protein